MQALIAAAAAPDYPAQIVGVLSNRADAEGLAHAAARGLPTAIVALRDYPDKAAADAAIDAVLRGWEAEIVCLAGFMRLLSAEFVARWEGRLLNIHPSLLPRHKGLDTHAQVIAARDAEHGCTVHFVTAGMDEGPPILQARIPVRADDTPETLAARVLVEEHRLYPRALAMLARGEVGFPHHRN